MVHQYPRAANVKVLLETLAQHHKEPSIESLAHALGLDDLQHAANWEAVIQYVESLDANGVHGHTPLVKVPAQLLTPMSNILN